MTQVPASVYMPAPISGSHFFALGLFDTHLILFLSSQTWMSFSDHMKTTGAEMGLHSPGHDPCKATIH